MWHRARYGAAAALLLGCGSGASPAPDAAPAPPGWNADIALPEPIANNAVTAIESTDGCTLYTALGIDPTRAPGGIHRRAYALTLGESAWRALPEVPGAAGRLAASAVSLRGKLYVLGGYAVSAGGAETTHDEVDVYDPQTEQWSAAAPLAVPTDDAMAIVWRDRWIVVISGWSANRAIDAVQLYDVETDAWVLAGPFPGAAVFGGAAAIHDDTLVMIDGVATAGGFSLVNQAWRATLDPNEPNAIDWSDLGAHPGPARYRAAPATLEARARLVFHGGTDDAYNFDGLSYESGQPSAPLASTLSFDLATGVFSLSAIPDKPTATMDHRALARCGEALYSVGGMAEGPSVTSAVWRFGAP